ncbi:hypothetical protein [Azospirillum argentinense]
MNKEYEARAATTANAIQLMANRWEALKINRVAHPGFVPPQRLKVLT